MAAVPMTIPTAATGHDGPNVATRPTDAVSAAMK